MNAPFDNNIEMARLSRLSVKGASVKEAKLRIALFSGNYNYVMDGPVRALNKLVEYLEQQGHEVLVFAPTVKRPVFCHSGELISIPSMPAFGFRGEYRLGLGLFGAAKRRLDDFAPDLIHIAAPDITGHAALKYAKARSIPIVASYHTRFDHYLKYYKAGWLERSATNSMRNFYHQCAHVYVPSQSILDELLRNNYRDNFRLWQRGVDRDIFNPEQRDMAWRRALGVKDSDILVAFVGRLVKEKGLDMLVRTSRLAAVKAPSLKMLIVGEGPMGEHLKRQYPQAIYTGYLQGSDLARAYASSDIFFNPSLTETFGNVTLEAMACGLPCVCAAASGALSLIEDGENGLLSPVDHGANDLAENIIALASDHKRRKDYAMNALNKAQGYSWSKVLDGLIGNYREVLADYHQPKPQ